jgi:hypothetical protein
MTETPEQIMARAIFLEHFHESDRTDDNFTKYKEEWNESWLQSSLQAEAAIAALKQAGFVIVPVEPTEAMIDGARSKLQVRVGMAVHYPNPRYVRNALVVAIQTAIKQGKQ